MGTNYYLRRGVCHACGHPEKEYHIGKSSCGWRFTFQAYNDTWDGFVATSAKDWKRETKDGVIADEYGRALPYGEFWDLVKKKRKEKLDHLEETRDGFHDPDGHSFIAGDFS